MKNNGLTQGFQYFYKNAEIWKKKARRYGKICKISKTRRYGEITRRYGEITRRYGKIVFFTLRRYGKITRRYECHPINSPIELFF
jgi:hypothetical protein